MARPAFNVAVFDIITGPSEEDLRRLRAQREERTPNHRRFRFIVKAKDEKAVKLVGGHADPTSFMVVLGDEIAPLESGSMDMNGVIEHPQVPQGNTFSCRYTPMRQHGHIAVVVDSE
jgi:hypothetical protein